MFKPRPKQQEVLDYQRGRMGVSAVPGSGKTSTLSYLAAHLVATVDLTDDQEILIVTLVKSAVGNFAGAMARYLKTEFNLLPGLGYRVRTLHGLANDIVRERPGLVGLASDFIVIDERAADDILQEAVETWVRANPSAADDYLTPEHVANAYTRSNHWPDTVKSMAMNFIRQAKDSQLTESQVRELLDKSGLSLPLAEMCYHIYEQYERGLRYRGAVDFQDLIRLALRVLDVDPQFMIRLRERWPYILEDEAQDSSLLQEQILRRLAGDNGNWVRVGDPNQAIFETFTTANPRYLRDFLTEKGVTAKTLPNSGRSTASIIRLSNQLIRWSLEHPIARNPRQTAPHRTLHRIYPARRPPGQSTRFARFGAVALGKILAGRGTRRHHCNRFASGCPIMPTRPSPSCCRSTAVARTWSARSVRPESTMWRICALPPAHGQSSARWR